MSFCGCLETSGVGVNQENIELRFGREGKRTTDCGGAQVSCFSPFSIDFHQVQDTRPSFHILTMTFFPYYLLSYLLSYLSSVRDEGRQR